MPLDDKIDFTTEWLVTIAVAVVAFFLGRQGFWPLSLCCTLADSALFVALLAHELDPARPRRPQHQSLSCKLRRKADTDRGSDDKSRAEG
jgi:hypothetical protein